MRHTWWVPPTTVLTISIFLIWSGSTYGIVGQDNEICKFSGRNAAFDILLKRCISAIQGADTQGFIQADALVRSPDAAVEIFAGYHAL